MKKQTKKAKLAALIQKINAETNGAKWTKLMVRYQKLTKR